MSLTAMVSLGANWLNEAIGSPREIAPGGGCGSGEIGSRDRYLDSKIVSNFD
jgi:hypothetical protein